MLGRDCAELRTISTDSLSAIIAFSSSSTRWRAASTTLRAASTRISLVAPIHASRTAERALSGSAFHMEFRRFEEADTVPNDKGADNTALAAAAEEETCCGGLSGLTVVSPSLEF